MSVAGAIDRHRLIACVGAGGVGKTTIAAAIALGAALRGRRAIALTIDPARALARALGLATLAPGGEAVPAAALAAAGLSPRGTLTAAMLDQKLAWDAFVARHAPSPSAARALIENPFYQRLSTSFAGSTEYMAIEELCHLAESDRYDLVVLDTPPAARAIDFLRAPERIDRLLDVDAAGWLARPYDAMRRSASTTLRFVLRRLEAAAGPGTLRDISTFFIALDALLAGVRERTRRARELLLGRGAAFVLVAGPRASILDETDALAAQLRARSATLAAVVVNRVHPPPAVSPAAAGGALDALGGDRAARWLRDRWGDVLAEASTEAALIEPFLASLPPNLARAVIPEAAHDLHSLRDLARVAAVLARGSSGAFTASGLA